MQIRVTSETSGEQSFLRGQRPKSGGSEAAQTMSQESRRNMTVRRQVRMVAYLPNNEVVTSHPTNQPTGQSAGGGSNGKLVV